MKGNVFAQQIFSLPDTLWIATPHLLSSLSWDWFETSRLTWTRFLTHILVYIPFNNFLGW